MARYELFSLSAEPSFPLSLPRRIAAFLAPLLSATSAAASSTRRVSRTASERGDAVVNVISNRGVAGSIVRASPSPEAPPSSSRHRIDVTLAEVTTCAQALRAAPADEPQKRGKRRSRLIRGYSTTRQRLRHPGSLCRKGMGNSSLHEAHTPSRCKRYLRGSQ